MTEFALTDDTDSARITPSHGFGKLTPYNSERAREASNRRWSIYRKAAEKGMIEGVIGESAPNSLKNRVSAFVQIVAKQAEAALTLNDNGTANTAAARFVREAIGADIGAPSSKNGDNGLVQSVTINISGDVALSIGADLVELLQGLKDNI